MAQARFYPPSMTISGTLGGLTFARTLQHAVVRVNNRRRRDLSPTEIERAAQRSIVRQRWATLTPEERATWNAAAEAAADPPFGFTERAVSGSQLHTASGMATELAGMDPVIEADESAGLRPAAPALWCQLTPDLLTMKIRGLEFVLPPGGLGTRTLLRIADPRKHRNKPTNAASRVAGSFTWDDGIPGFTKPAAEISVTLPLVEGGLFSLANRLVLPGGAVGWVRWTNVEVPAAGEQTAAFVRPVFFGLKSPAIQIRPGPVVTIIETIDPSITSYTEDFSTPPGQTIGDVLSWIANVADWQVLEADEDLEDLPADRLVPFDRHVVTLNWQPKALFVSP